MSQLPVTGKGPGSRRRRNRFQPTAERMESRRLLATITVTSTGDTVANDGLVTLREAILAANTNADPSGDTTPGTAGLDTINFNIPGTGPFTINLTAALPTITEPVLMNGYSQTGSSANTSTTGNNALPLIVVNGGGLGVNGLTIDTGASGSTISGLVLNGFNNALVLNGANNLISGNFIGTNPTGTAAGANPNTTGILVQGANNTVGGTAAAARNLIAGGTGNGISVQGATTAGTLIQGNFIGTNAAGTSALGNSLSGITLGTGATNTSIGGTAAGAANVISGLAAGIDLGNTAGNQVQGNFIGTDLTGTTNLGTAGSGILAGSATNSSIGGTTVGAANTIANTLLGTGTGSAIATGVNTGISILGNSIFANAGAGISGGSTGPLINSVTSTNIGGTFAGASTTSYRIEYFATQNTGGTSNAQGRTLLGFQDVTTDASGNATLSFTPNGGVPAGQFITATATTSGTNGSTTAFSTGVLSTPNTSDLSASITSAPNPIAPGGTLTNAITVTNLGQLAATNAFVTIDTPANTTFQSFTAPTGWTITQQPNVGGTGTIRATIPTLANQGTATFTLSTLVGSGVTGGTTLSSTATVGSDVTDDVTTNNTATSTTTVQQTTGNPDLAVTITGSPQTVAPGGNVTYTVTLTGDTTGNTTVSIPLPANTTFVSFAGPSTFTNSPPNVGSGGTVTATSANGTTGTQTFTLVAQVSPTATSGTTLNTTATVTSAGGTDTNTANNTATATTTVTAAQTDTTPPTVTDVVRYGFHSQPTLLVATFSEPVDETAASDPANYSIMLPDGKEVSVEQAFYNSSTNEVTLRTSQRIYAFQTSQLIIADGAITDLAGNTLDGDNDGVAGGPAAINFDRNSIVGTAGQAPDASNVGVATSTAAAIAAAKKFEAARAAQQAAQLRAAQAKSKHRAHGSRVVAEHATRAKKQVSVASLAKANGTPASTDASLFVGSDATPSRGSALKRLLRRLSR